MEIATLRVNTREVNPDFAGLHERVYTLAILDTGEAYRVAQRATGVELSFGFTPVGTLEEEIERLEGTQGPVSVERRDATEEQALAISAAAGAYAVIESAKAEISRSMAPQG